jgi:hypothetical protein
VPAIPAENVNSVIWLLAVALELALSGANASAAIVSNDGRWFGCCCPLRIVGLGVEVTGDGWTVEELRAKKKTYWTGAKNDIILVIILLNGTLPPAKCS